MKRHPPFAIPFHARNFGAAETAGAVDADAFGAKPHRRLHRSLHGAAECNTALKLLRNRFGNQLGIELGFADFNDIDDDVAVGEFGDRLAKLLDVGTLLANHDAGPRRVYRHPALFVRPLDNNMRDRRLLELLHQLFANLDIFVQQGAVFRLAREPARVPGAVDPDAQPDRIDFLTHRLLLRPLPAPRPDAPRWSGEKTV